MKPNFAEMTVFWRSILILALLFAILLLTLNGLRNNLSYRSFAQTVGPTKIILTDITKDGAGIVYHTDTAESTLIKYQVGGQELVAIDILGTRPLKNHYARLVNLPSDSAIPIDISGQKIVLKTLPLGEYHPLQVKIITGTIPSQTIKEWTDAVVVLQTNDKYFATRSDVSGNWLISWVNNSLPDGSTQVAYPIYDSNLVVYPPDGVVYQFPFSWTNIQSISASVITPKAPDLPVPTFWDQLRKFFLTFLPNFSLLTSNS